MSALAPASGASPPRARPLVSVITVTYQSEAFVRDALASIIRVAAADRVPIELIVVDNASTDGTVDAVAEAFPEAMLLRNAENVGFGRANMRGFAVARGEWWLLLNPDATALPGMLSTLVGFALQQPRAGAVAPSVVPPAGASAESAGMLPGIRSMIAHLFGLNRLVPGDRWSPWSGFLLRPGPVHPRRVGWATAAVLLLRADAVRAIGGFDETIFLYGEDIDLCARLGEHGWETWLVPAARADHLVGGTQSGVSTRWVDGLDGVYGRRASRPSRLLFDLVMAVGFGLRAVVATGRGPGSARQSRRMRAASLRALRLALGAALGRPRDRAW